MPARPQLSRRSAPRRSSPPASRTRAGRGPRPRRTGTTKIAMMRVISTVPKIAGPDAAVLVRLARLLGDEPQRRPVNDPRPRTGRNGSPPRTRRTWDTGSARERLAAPSSRARGGVRPPSRIASPARPPARARPRARRSRGRARALPGRERRAVGSVVARKTGARCCCVVLAARDLGQLALLDRQPRPRAARAPRRRRPAVRRAAPRPPRPPLDGLAASVVHVERSTDAPVRAVLPTSSTQKEDSY